jgi:hypothetical protein
MDSMPHGSLYEQQCLDKLICFSICTYRRENTSQPIRSTCAQMHTSRDGQIDRAWATSTKSINPTTSSKGKERNKRCPTPWRLLRQVCQPHTGSRISSTSLSTYPRTNHPSDLPCSTLPGSRLPFELRSQPLHLQTDQDTKRCLIHGVGPMS